MSGIPTNKAIPIAGDTPGNVFKKVARVVKDDIARKKMPSQPLNLSNSNTAGTIIEIFKAESEKINKSCNLVINRDN